MLHFRSTNAAAHTADPADIARLHALLGDHVWAFSNCRVDTPGMPVAEVDWLFYNTVKGSFVLSEWKRFPAAVVQVMDVGAPWVLADRSAVGNPLEQVARQLDAVRGALRRTIVRKHFSGIDEQNVNAFQSVYSPQLSDVTQHERLRYGAVYGTLDGLAARIERRTVAGPLLAPEGPARVKLAEDLAGLFRCALSATARRKLLPPAPAGPTPAHRIAAIHRELAALHTELADLVGRADDRSAAAPVAPAVPVRPATIPPAQVPAQPAVSSALLRRHVLRHVPTTGTAGPLHVRAAFLAALEDRQLRASGVHVGLFGSLVGQQLGQDRNLASLALGGLTKWCLAQAADAGVRVAKDPLDPSVVRLVHGA